MNIYDFNDFYCFDLLFVDFLRFEAVAMEKLLVDHVNFSPHELSRSAIGCERCNWSSRLEHCKKWCP